jgi:hypothetical protein
LDKPRSAAAKVLKALGRKVRLVDLVVEELTTLHRAEQAQTAKVFLAVMVLRQAVVAAEVPERPETLTGRPRVETESRPTSPEPPCSTPAVVVLGPST